MWLIGDRPRIELGYIGANREWVWGRARTRINLESGVIEDRSGIDRRLNEDWFGRSGCRPTIHLGWIGGSNEDWFEVGRG